MALAQLPNDDTMADINITPFTDVLLVLLIIFMLSATAVVQNSFQVNLPKATTVEKSDKKIVSVTLTGDGKLYVDRQQTTTDGLATALQQAHNEKKTGRLLLLADKTVPYGQIATVMDAGKQAGFSKIGLATRPK